MLISGILRDERFLAMTFTAKSNALHCHLGRVGFFQMDPLVDINGEIERDIRLGITAAAGGEDNVSQRQKRCSGRRNRANSRGGKEPDKMEAGLLLANYYKMARRT